MCENSEEFVRLGDSLSSRNRSSISASDDGGSISGEIETGPSDSDLLRILECPVCTEFPTPPIFNCAKGHFTCNDCIGLLRECTLCQSPFTQVRNYALESIIERTRFKCKYANRGCQETAGGTGGEYKKHLDTCQYGPLLCNERMSTVCERHPVDPEDYLEHLFSCHDASGQYVKSSNHLIGEFVQIKDDVFPPIYLKSETSQQTFILNTKKYKSFLCWWVTSLDLGNIGSYKAKLTWNKNVVDRQVDEMDILNDCLLQWTLPIHPMKKPFDEVRDSGLCAVIPVTHLNPFLNDSDSEEAAWKIRVEIIKKDETHVIKENVPINFMDNLRHYFPLITTVFMIFSLSLLVGMYVRRDSKMPFIENGRVSSGQNPDDYYGYRGFYYHSDIEKPTNEFESGKPGKNREKFDNRKKVRDSKEPDDYYVGYGGFYYRNQNTDAESDHQPEGLFMKIIGKLLGLKQWRSFSNGKHTSWVDVFDLMTRFSAVFMTFLLIVSSVYYCNFTRWTI